LLLLLKYKFEKAKQKASQKTKPDFGMLRRSILSEAVASFSIASLFFFILKI